MKEKRSTVVERQGMRITAADSNTSPDILPTMFLATETRDICSIVEFMVKSEGSNVHYSIT